MPWGSESIITRLSATAASMLIEVAVATLRRQLGFGIVVSLFRPLDFKMSGSIALGLQYFRLRSFGISRFRLWSVGISIFPAPGYRNREFQIEIENLNPEWVGRSSGVLGGIALGEGGRCREHRIQKQNTEYRTLIPHAL